MKAKWAAKNWYNKSLGILELDAEKAPETSPERRFTLAPQLGKIESLPLLYRDAGHWVPAKNYLVEEDTAASVTFRFLATIFGSPTWKELGAV
jgi:hypothetical protein